MIREKVVNWLVSDREPETELKDIPSREMDKIAIEAAISEMKKEGFSKAKARDIADRTSKYHPVYRTSVPIYLINNMDRFGIKRTEGDPEDSAQWYHF